MKKICFATVALSVLAGGCGGGGGSSSGTQQGLHTASLGTGTVTYSGKLVPAGVFSSNGVTVTSMAGANFSSVTLTPAQKIQNSLIAFDMGDEIWTWQNGVISQVTHLLISNVIGISVSKTGLIAFSAYDRGTNHQQIFTCNADGSALRMITSSAQDHFAPSWSPSASKIVIQNNTTGTLDTMNQDGSGETPLTLTNPNLSSVLEPAWSPDGSKIAFIGYNTSSSLFSVFVAGNTGGTATELTPSFGSSILFPRWSPDGTQIAFAVDSGNYQIEEVSSTIPGDTKLLTTPASGSYDSYPSFSPDGTGFCWENQSGAGYSLQTQLIGEPGSATTVASYATTGNAPVEPFWSGFFGTKTFIGSGGQMNNAAGFLWSQVGDGFGGFVSIAATTPSKLTIALQPGSTPGGAAVYLASADAITKIVYTNVYYGALTALTPSGVSQVLLSVSTASGQIDTIAPLSEKASPVIATRGGGSAYDGKFTAIYDAHGKNLAPSGAKHIDFDSKGALESWN